MCKEMLAACFLSGNSYSVILCLNHSVSQLGESRIVDASLTLTRFEKRCD